MGLVGRLGEQAEHRAHEPVADHCQDADHEEVGGRGEHAGRLADATEVPERDPRDGQDAQDDAVGIQLRQRRGQGGDARDDRHGYRQDVVDQQRRRRGQGGVDAEVVLGDEIGAAPLRVRRDRLAVGDDDHRQQRGDAQRHGKRVAERRAAREDEHQQDFLGRIGHRRERVGGEHRQRRRLPEPLVSRLGERHGRADQQALDQGQSHTRHRLYGARSPGEPAGRNFYAFFTPPRSFLTPA